MTHDSFRRGLRCSKLPPLAAEKALGDSCEPDVVNSHEWRDSALLAVNGAQCQSLQLIYSSSGQQLQKLSLAYFTVMSLVSLSVKYTLEMATEVIPKSVYLKKTL